MSAENPEQYIGGSGGGGVVVLPICSGDVLCEPVEQRHHYSERAELLPGFHRQDGGGREGPCTLKSAASLSTFKVYNPATITKFTKVGGGFQANVNVAVTKGFRLIANTFWSDGDGRYLFGFAPNLAIRGDGSIGLIKSAGTADGFEFTHKNTLIYAYYGGSYVGQVQRDRSSEQQVRRLRISRKREQPEPDRTGAHGRLQSDDLEEPAYGALNFMGQYAYFTRNPWAVASGTPKETHMNEVFINLRYTLPGSAPNLK